MTVTLPFRSAAAACALIVAAGTARAQLPQLDLDSYVSGVGGALHLIQDPWFPNVQYVVQQRGMIRVVEDGALGGTFLDLTALVNQDDNEGGLLGLAFPDDVKDNRFYISYTDRVQPSGHSHIVRYERMAGNPLQGDPSTAEEILFQAQPFSNHNGGNIVFGPDGFLYIGFGDGGSGGDPGHRAQNIGTWLGKILRIDVSPATGYDIPPDNPFVDNDPVNALEEIWAFGVRNPWRWSFDNPDLGGTGAMLLADVGQDAWEEVNFEQPGDGGRNYGWRNREGAHPFNNTLPPAYMPLIDPIFERPHPTGGSITGGYVYRGNKLGSVYRGRYFVGDFITQRVWSFDLDQTGGGAANNIIEHTGDLGGPGNISSFGQDVEGELYIVNITGTVRKIVPSETTTITDVEMIFGDSMVGGLDEILRSDDSFLEVESQFGFSASEANITEIGINATTDANAPTLLDVILELRIDNPGGVGQIRMRNFNNGDLVIKGSYNPGQSEQVFRFDDLRNPDRFVGPNGEVELRSRNVVVATFAASGFTSFYDQVCIVVRD